MGELVAKLEENNLLRTPTVVPIQLQLEYTRKDSRDRVLRVITTALPLTENRDEAERDINAPCVALHAVRTAARLAQQGDYRRARVQLISGCRLLQRAMHKVEHQNAYLGF